MYQVFENESWRELTDEEVAGLKMSEAIGATQDFDSLDEVQTFLENL